MHVTYGLAHCEGHLDILFYALSIVLMVHFRPGKAYRYRQRKGLFNFWAKAWCPKSLPTLCCDRKSRAACVQSFTPWQQATIEITRWDHSIIVCSRHIHNGVILHSHPVRGESHNQRNTTGAVATTSPPFYNEPHRSHVLCVKAEPRTTFTSWSQYHFVAIGNPEWHVHRASHRGSKQQ